MTENFSKTTKDHINRLSLNFSDSDKFVLGPDGHPVKNRLTRKIGQMKRRENQGNEQPKVPLKEMSENLEHSSNNNVNGKQQNIEANHRDWSDKQQQKTGVGDTLKYNQPKLDGQIKQDNQSIQMNVNNDLATEKRTKSDVEPTKKNPQDVQTSQKNPEIHQKSDINSVKNNSIWSTEKENESPDECVPEYIIAEMIDLF